MLGRFGRSSVTVECFSSVDLILNGPSNRGINFATRLELFALNSCHRWSVDKTTRSPTLKGKVSERDLLLWKAWETLAVMRLSCASETFNCIVWIRLCVSISVGVVRLEEKRGGRR